MILCGVLKSKLPDVEGSIAMLLVRREMPFKLLKLIFVICLFYVMCILCIRIRNVIEILVILWCVISVYFVFADS